MNLFLPRHLKLFLCLLTLAMALPKMSRASHGAAFFSNPDFQGSEWMLPVPGNKMLAVIKKEKEQAQVLQKCFGLEGLQAYYPKNTDGTYKPLQILQHGVSFADDLDVSYAGNPVALIQKASLAADRIEAYFLFYEFAITGKSAKVRFVFNYDQTTNQKKMQVVSLELQKEDDAWNIVQSKIEGRGL
jgi:hypothetical protein